MPKDFNDKAQDIRNAIVKLMDEANDADWKELNRALTIMRGVGQ